MSEPTTSDVGGLIARARELKARRDAAREECAAKNDAIQAFGAEIARAGGIVCARNVNGGFLTFEARPSGDTFTILFSGDSEGEETELGRRMQVANEAWRAATFRMQDLEKAYESAVRELLG